MTDAEITTNSTPKGVEHKESYAEVHNDYFDESDHFWRIDAWKTSDDDETGKVIEEKKEKYHSFFIYLRSNLNLVITTSI